MADYTPWAENRSTEARTTSKPKKEGYQRPELDDTIAFSGKLEPKHTFVIIEAPAAGWDSAWPRVDVR